MVVGSRCENHFLILHFHTMNTFKILTIAVVALGSVSALNQGQVQDRLLRGPVGAPPGWDPPPNQAPQPVWGSKQNFDPHQIHVIN